MTQYLSLVIDEAVVRGLVAEISGSRISIHQAFKASPPHSLLSSETAKNQEWLRETLVRLGIRADQILVTVARDLGVMRRLELPAVPAGEWPIHVGFQARTKLAQSLDSLAWDFLPLLKDDKGQAVQFTGMTKAALQNLQKTLSGAGLKLAQIHLTPLAVMEFLANAQPARRLHQVPAAMVVNLIDDRLELVLLQHGSPSAIHAARVADDEQRIPQLLTEVTRGSLAFQKLLPVQSPVSLLLNAPDSIAAEFAAALQQRFGQTPELIALPSNVSCERLEGADSFEFSSSLEGMGLLLSKVGKHPTIDLLAPRRPQPQRDYRKRRLAILAVGILAVAGTGGGLYAKTWAEQSRKIADLKKEDGDFDPFLSRGEPILKSGGAVESWLETKVDPLEEIRQFTANLPGSDRMYLTEVQFDPIVGSNPGGHRATISVHGKAQERTDIIKLEEKLIKIPGKYQVLPHKVKPLSPPPPGQQQEKKPYSVEFDLTVNLARVGEPEKPKSDQPTDAKSAGDKPTEDKPAGGSNPLEPKPAGESITPPAKPEEKSATPPAVPTNPPSPPEAGDKPAPPVPAPATSASTTGGAETATPAVAAPSTDVDSSDSIESIRGVEQ